MPGDRTSTAPSLMGSMDISNSNPWPETVGIVCLPGLLEDMEHSNTARLVNTKGG
jgi:hypothetical protein